MFLRYGKSKLREGVTRIPDGGNHAQFGSYGTQKGDGAATISAEEQCKITVDTILKTINSK